MNWQKNIIFIKLKTKIISKEIIYKKFFIIIFNLILHFLIKYILKTKNISFDNLEFIENFAKLNSKNILYDNLKEIPKFNNSKISIVIPVYNGENFLKTSLCSIQNQDFKEIEIIIIDDNSQDGSSKIINKSMSEDERIAFLKNKENKGALYSKSIGVLYSKGKYVMTLDVDDLYASKNAFSILYKESEKNKLDMLGFGSLNINININFNITKQKRYTNYYNSDILRQPKISQIVYYNPKLGNAKIKQFCIWCYFFKTELFVNAIKSINKKYFDRIINIHDDLLLLFPLTRRAKKFKNIKRILHLYSRDKTSNNLNLIEFRLNVSKR